MNEKLKSKLESLPALPGVYQFIDKHEKIIYVGKAKNLRNRVRSYFHSTVDSPKTQVMVSKVEDFQLIVTDSEMEALVLENNLIKDLKPRYNVNLKDDKSFPYIRVTNEPFPQIFPTRDIIKDGSKYFGPYTDVKSMKASLRMINKLFKIRSCKYFIDDEAIRKKKIKVCLDYHIKKCDGPCEGLISEIEYKDMVGEVVKLLRGKTEDLINELKEKMQIASSKFKFEKAAEIRDRIDQLQVYSDKQKIVSNDFQDRTASAVTAVGFYDGKEIIIETEPFEKDSLIEWLNTKAMKPVKFIIPQRKSEAMSLLNMSKQNAILQLKEIQLQRMKKEGNVPYVLSALKRDLHLKNIPKKIECFDISNLQGTDTVASMVVFVEGKPKKSEYRKFLIQSVDGPDDFASMQEVIERRYSKLINENLPLPDLIMVDGGKGQLSSAVEILDRIIGKDKYEIIGLAKRLEEVILKDVSEPQSIPKTSSSLKLLQHLRDEAHRFAITFHRERRNKRTFTTELLEIKGIGKTIAEKLLKEFKSIDDIKSSSKEDLRKIIGNAKADIIVNHYSNKN